MLLSDLNIRFNNIMNSLMGSLQKEGIAGLFNSPNCMKEHLNITEQDIYELNNESVIYCQHNDWKLAAECLVWLTFLEPLNPSHFLRLGSVLLQNKQYPQALSYLTAGSLLDEENPEFFLYIGSCYLELGEKQKAKDAFTACVQLSENNSEHKKFFLLATQACYT